MAGVFRWLVVKKWRAAKGRSHSYPPDRGVLRYNSPDIVVESTNGSFTELAVAAPLCRLVAKRVIGQSVGR